MTGSTSKTAVGFGVELGIYEKALQWTGDWNEFFASAAAAGFSFVDLSLDESDDRIARLDWSLEERHAVRDAAEHSGILLGGLCLSVHRRIAPGSSDAAMRAKAADVLYRGIELCHDLGMSVLQLAGYFAYYEGAAHPRAHEWYVETLRKGARYAARLGVVLGIENVDGTDITSISRAIAVINEIDSPWLQLYPDIGNLAEQSLDAVAELRAGAGHMVALHVKETRPGEPRRVAMGQGVVDWESSFTELVRQEWSGRVMIEMWNDDAPESASLASEAREFIAARLTAAGMPVLGIHSRKKRQRTHA